MASDNERNQRFGNAESAKTSALSRFLGSDVFLFIVMSGLGVLNCGWIFFPVLGTINSWLNAAIIAGIVVVGVCGDYGGHYD